MKLPLALLVWLAPLPLAAQAAAPAAAATSSAATGAKVWVGRYAEFEEYLRTAPITRVERVPVGVTKPERAFFAPGGLGESAIVKHLPAGNRKGFWEAYYSEIAAYEMDRLLGFDMVPPTVERSVKGELASVQLWLDGTQYVRNVDQKACPTPTEWAKQVWRQRVFDNLVANIDSNEGNMLVDGAWNLILIDHSRAFASDTMPFEKEMTRIDREAFDRIVALDEAGLRERVRPWLSSDDQMRNILKRRDKIVNRFEKLVQKKGRPQVMPF
jgi:hypothetical protein